MLRSHRFVKILQLWSSTLVEHGILEVYFSPAMRWMMEVVDCPVTAGMIAILPP